ncbi:MAG TPA: AIR synthase-related protein, partial [Chthoniobacterales bacterium]
EKEAHITTQFFKAAGDVIFLVGEVGRDLGGSRFLKVCYGKKVGPPPRLDIEREIEVQNAVRELIREGLVKSAHDCSEGGLAVALAECCFNPDQHFGADVDLSDTRMSGDENLQALENLFNESQSRIVISCEPANADQVYTHLENRSVPCLQLGKVGVDQLRISANGVEARWPIETIHDDWFNAIRRAVESDAEPVRSL